MMKIILIISHRVLSGPVGIKSSPTVQNCPFGVCSGWNRTNYTGVYCRDCFVIWLWCASSMFYNEEIAESCPDTAEEEKPDSDTTLYISNSLNYLT